MHSASISGQNDTKIRKNLKYPGVIGINGVDSIKLLWKRILFSLVLEKWNGLPPDDKEKKTIIDTKPKNDDNNNEVIEKLLEEKEKEYGPLLKENSEIENDIGEGSSGMVWM